jgi:glutamate racemase
MCRSLEHMDGRPVGMFDSGFGGLTVARALIDLAPHENLVYVGDTGRYPYGPRPLDEVRGFALQIARWLVDEVGVKLLVVACNTASAAALDSLRTLLRVPVIGVIDPGVRALASATRNRRVGVVGTVGTIASGAYQRAIAALPVPLELVPASCPGFVEFVERDETRSDQVSVLAERLLAPVRDAGVDALLLGCTHYPFLARTIGEVMGRDVVLVSSADETAFEVRATLADSALRAQAYPGTMRVYSSGDVDWFRTVGSRLFGGELGEVRRLDWPPAPLVPAVGNEPVSGAGARRRHGAASG